MWNKMEDNYCTFAMIVMVCVRVCVLLSTVLT